MEFLSKIRNLIKLATVTGAADNSTQIPVQQMKFKKKLVDAMQIFPYGFYGNCSSNDSLGIVFSIEGHDSVRGAISYTPYLRPRDLEQNENSFYHPYTNSSIKNRNSGDIEVKANAEQSDGTLSTGKIIIEAQHAVFDLSANFEVNCSVANITAPSSVNIDSPSTNLGVGGNPIARVGDSVEVTITSGSSSGTWSGTITSGGANTSI